MSIYDNVAYGVRVNGLARTRIELDQIVEKTLRASALDPISTAKIEELIYDLKKTYMIVIVTHNMQQAARVSDETGFFLSGRLVEFNETKRLFTAPAKRETEDYITGRFG